MLALATLAGSIVLLILLFLAREAWPAIASLGPARFLSDPGWYPTEGEYLLLPMIAGTGIAAGGAMALAVPLGIASAIFGRFYAPRSLARWHRRMVSLLAGIPSVVFGLWGLVVLVPLISNLGGSGQSVLAAALVLALMVLPTVALTSDDALGSVPPDVLQGGAALGLGRWALARRVAVPAAASGIGTGIILAGARAIGETIAVLMIAGNVAQVPDSLLEPVRTLTANIALEMGYATRSHRAVLFVSGLALMLVAALLVGSAELLHRRRVDPRA